MLELHSSSPLYMVLWYRKTTIRGGRAAIMVRQMESEMIVNSERKGNLLVLTIKLADKPYRSKSALAKALAKGLAPETVPETSLATSGGFQRIDDVRVSLNVMI